MLNSTVTWTSMLTSLITHELVTKDTQFIHKSGNMYTYGVYVRFYASGGKERRWREAYGKTCAICGG